MNIVTLLDEFVTGLLRAEEDFMKDLGSFPEYEEAVRDMSNRMASSFLSLSLTAADELIRQSGKRKAAYNIQRKDTRTLISTVGDIRFQSTLFRNKTTGKYEYLLERMLRLPEHERMTTMAEAQMITEAQVYSYQHAADRLAVSDQTISKTTVMNKIHAIEAQLPEEKPLDDEDKKKCRYLYIEADEDHIHRQNGGKDSGCMIGKLIYLFEGKEDVCEGKRRLIHAHYFGGLYPGKENGMLWDEVEAYIQAHYDQKYLKRVYICSDGGSWIKAGVDHVYRSLLVADKFHLMKYINRAANVAGPKKNKYKKKFYKYIWKQKPAGVQKQLDRLERKYGGCRALDEARIYFMNNWTEIERAYHDKHALGCSAEGHVSNVFSDRMSSRPMGWSEVGSDRMCKLRCYVKNNGKSKVVDLVRWRREHELERCLPATGTDGMIEPPQRKRYSKSQREAFTYVERLQATLGATSTVRKTMAIREQIGNI